MTKPGWKKVAREHNYHDDNKGIVMVHIDQNNLDKINPIIGNYNVSGFPTMLYVHKNKVIPYENSNIKNKNRSAESFREWINSYLGNSNNPSNSHNSRSNSHSSLRSKSNNKLNFMSEFMSNNKSRSSSSSRSRSKSHASSRSSSKNTRKNTHRRKKSSQMGGKWSLKYKKSINCKRPRGFSQKQHCKYGKRK